MALIDDKPRLLEALGKIPKVKQARTSWPEDWAQVPCIILGEANNAPAVRYDNREHITELEYFVRVFAAGEAERQRIASDVDDVMMALDYERTWALDEDGSGIRQKAMRYRRYF